MTRRPLLVALALASLAGLPAAAQQAPQPAEPRPFRAGTPLAPSANVKIHGAFRFAESCVYDASRDLYVVPSAGVAQNIQPNDGYVSLINPDGTVHTPKWIGATRDGLTLNQPLGSEIANGRLYVADINVIRWFDLATGAPLGEIEVAGAAGFNDIAVDAEGTVFASQTGTADGQTPTRLYRIAADGTATIVVEGAPLAMANGVAFDADGNVVVVNIGSPDVLTFDRDGKHLKTEQSADTGNDGIVILPDGTKLVSSVRNGTLSRIPSGGAAEIIATGIPSAASICHDPVRNVVVAPMNNNNAIALIALD